MRNITKLNFDFVVIGGGLTGLCAAIAAARGGYTAVCTMPNLSPVPDSKQSIELQLDAIKKRVVDLGADIGIAFDGDADR